MSQRNEHPEELLAPFVDGELTGAETRGVEDHVATCERCRGEIERARSVRARLAALPAPPIPVGLGTPAIAKVRGGYPWGRARWAMAAAAAAVVAVLVVTTFGTDEPGFRAGRDDTTTLEAPEGEPQEAAASPPAFVVSDRDFTSEELREQARSAIATNEDAGLEEGASDGAATERELDSAEAMRALDCIRRSGLDPDEGGLRLIEQARFEGTPAYLAFFETSERSEIWVISRAGCEIQLIARQRG